MNSVNLIGRTTRDIELKHTQSGTSVASFSLAVDRGFKDKDGNKQTDFIDMVAWKGTADALAKYVTKGQLIGISGSLQVRPWEDKDGNKRKSTEVIVSNFYFCESKKNSNNESYTSSTAPYDYSTPVADLTEDQDDDDLPF